MDSTGAAVPDSTYEITFTIWSDSTSTAPQDRKWISPSCTVRVSNGLFNWQLGTRENLPPWTVTHDADLWIGTQVGTDPEITPRTRLCSVPYAYKTWQAEWAGYADSAGFVVTGSDEGWVDDGTIVRLASPSDSVGIGVQQPEERLDIDGTAQMTGFKMPTSASSGRVLTSDANGNGTWGTPALAHGESGGYDGIVSADMVETDPGGATVVNFASAFTSTVKPVLHVHVVLKQAANGLVEGAAVKAVVDIKGAANNWTGFDITVSKYSDGSSISDATEVFVTWMAIEKS
jgi:hypothetical protein